MTRYWILVAAAAAAFGQPAESIRSCPSEKPVYAILNAPFAADQQDEVILNSRAGTRTVRSNSIYRDSEGRTRAGGSLTGFINGISIQTVPAEDRIDIVDPVAASAYTLDTKHRVAHRCVLGSIQRLRLTGQPLPQNPSELDLGTKIIEGVLAYGSRWPKEQPNHNPSGNTIETWNSPELSKTLVLKTTLPGNDQTSLRLLNIVRTDPEPSLFQIPSGYTVVND